MESTREDRGFDLEQQGLTRRDLIKKGALLGGTVMWVTPVVQTVGMSRALAQTPSDVCVPTDGESVVGVAAGTGATGNANRVLVGDGSAYTLGLGGSVTVLLEAEVFPGTGVNAVVIETGVSGDEESGKVEVSQDNVTFHLVGTFTTSGGFNLVPVDPNDVPNSFRYVRVTDTSTGGDGIDVDYIAAGCQ